MSGLLVAARYLTILPLPASDHGSLDNLGRAAAWFPVVGFGIGAGLVLVDRVTTWLFPSLLSALLVVTAWKLLTGGLHLDGLADCLDGLVGRDPAQRLAIMRDSRIGAFGAVGLILFLFLEVAAVSEIGTPWRWGALLTAPAFARATPPLTARLFRTARPYGHGAAFRAGLSRAAAPVALAVASLVALLGLGPGGLVATAVALAAAVLVAWFLAARLGGITGDVLGASIEAAELVTLLAVSAWTHPRL